MWSIQAKCNCKRTSDIYIDHTEGKTRTVFSSHSSAREHFLPGIISQTLISELFIYLDSLLLFGWLLSEVVAPQCSGWPRGPAAAGLRRQWNKMPDTPERSNPRVPPIGYAKSGHRRRWLVLCRNPDTLLAEVAEEQCEGETCYYGCYCGSALLHGSGCHPGSEFDCVLEEAGFCPCP